jgi:hypothetical protein
MAQMGPAEGYEEECSTDDDDDLDVVRSTRIGLGDSDKYIESKCGTDSDHSTSTQLTSQMS